MLPCSRQRHRAQIDCGKFRQEADPHALRRKHFYCQRRTFPLHECFFPANFIGIKASVVHDTSFHIMKCDVDIRVNSCIPVMLSGDTTMFQEFGDRMTKNPTEVASTHPLRRSRWLLHQRQYSVRFGGSVLFLFSFFPADVGLKGEYDGSGPTVVHWKCF